MKKITLAFTAFLCAMTLTACNTASTVEENTKEDLAKIEESMKKDVAEAEDISKEKIDEAITYIHENIDKLKEKDAEVTKKVYEYSVYLEEVAKKEGTAIEHDIAAFANKAKAYAQDAYIASEEELKALVDKGEAELKELGTAIHNEKDKLVEEFHKLINKK